MSTLRGLAIMDGDRAFSLSTADGLSGNEVHDILEFGNEVYLDTDGGLTVLSPR